MGHTREGPRDKEKKGPSKDVGMVSFALQKDDRSSCMKNDYRTVDFLLLPGVKPL